jgi:hypothetical protein
VISISSNSFEGLYSYGACLNPKGNKLPFKSSYPTKRSRENFIKKYFSLKKAKYTVDPTSVDVIAKANLKLLRFPNQES